jgi:tripartite-type tricarboxylate transporter receptor subunit TctC
MDIYMSILGRVQPAFAVGLLLLAAPAAAQYPERPIRLILSSAPGASSDVVSRILADELIKQMGRQIIIDNRPGAVQTIGTGMVVRANPDGYTIGYANVVTLAINKALLPDQPYDTDKDLALVGQFLSTYNLLAVSNALPVRSVKELIDYAKENPGRLLNASSGNGTTGHLGGELFKIMTGTKIVHVPYKGTAQAIPDLLSGQVQVIFDNLTSISPHARSGKVRALGVSSLKRSSIFPDVPTISEAGVTGYETNSWGGVVVPVRTPRAIVLKLNAEINKALQSPTLKQRYAAIEAEPTGGTPEQFAAYVRQERIKWAEVVKKSGAKVD